MKAAIREHASGLVWSKSSYSSEEGGECVEVAISHHAVHIRDSKDIARPGLTVDAEAWKAFVGFAAQ
jgi:hypothetical protein